MKALKNKDTRFKPYNFFNKENVLLSAQILNNIKLLHFQKFALIYEIFLGRPKIKIFIYN